MFRTVRTIRGHPISTIRGPGLFFQSLRFAPSSPRQNPTGSPTQKNSSLFVQLSGALLWRVKYRFHGIERRISFGRFPKVSLKQAREECDEAHFKLEDGIDTYVERRGAKIEAKIAAEATLR